MKRLSRLDILEYALAGARTERGIYSGLMSEEEEGQLDEDIAEIERRIARTNRRMAPWVPTLPEARILEK
jgi:hypothetical protein